MNYNDSTENDLLIPNMISNGHVIFNIMKKLYQTMDDR